jgi:hypothetical protein
MQCLRPVRCCRAEDLRKYTTICDEAHTRPITELALLGRIDECLGQDKKGHAIPFIIQHFLPPYQILNGALQAKGHPEIQLPRPRNAMI